MDPSHDWYATNGELLLEAVELAKGDEQTPRDPISAGVDLMALFRRMLKQAKLEDAVK